MRERKNNPRFEEYRSSDENIFEGKNAVWELVRSGREIEKIMFSKGSIGSIGHILAKATREAIDKDGPIGIFTGSLMGAAGGIESAVIFSWLAALLFRAKKK